MLHVVDNQSVSHSMLSDVHQICQAFFDDCSLPVNDDHCHGDFVDLILILKMTIIDVLSLPEFIMVMVVLIIVIMIPLMFIPSWLTFIRSITPLPLKMTDHGVSFPQRQLRWTPMLFHLLWDSASPSPNELPIFLTTSVKSINDFHRSSTSLRVTTSVHPTYCPNRLFH